MWCNLGEKKDLQGRRRGGGTKRKQRNNSSPFFLLPSPFSFIRNEASVFFFFLFSNKSTNRRFVSNVAIFSPLTDYLFIYFCFFFFTTKHACFSFARLEKLFVLSIRKLIAIFFFYFLFLFGYLSRVVLFRFRDVKGCVRFIWRIINPNSREWGDF